MPSRRGFLAATAAAVGGLAGCVARGRRSAARVPTDLVGRSGTTAPLPGDERRVQSFSWTRGDETLDLDVAIPENLLAYARARPRVRHRGTYVADPFHDRLFRTLAADLAALADDGRVGDRGDAPDRDPTDGGRTAFDVARTFVQQLPYETDRESTGTGSYPRYPVETLADGRADCEDAAVLLAGLLERLGHDVVLLAFWEANHMGLGLATDAPGPGRYVHEGRRYAYLETAVPGWAVGEVPDLVGEERPEVMPIDDRPSLTAEWELERRRVGLGTRVDVRNVGDGSVDACRVRLALLGAEGEELAVRRSRTGSLDAGDEATFQATVRPPAARIEAARIEVRADGEIVDAADVGR